MARRFYEEALQLKRKIGFQRGEGWGLACLGLLHHHQGENTKARQHCEHALRLFTELGDRIGQGFALNRLGHALLGLGRLEDAAAAYHEALALRRALGQPHQAVETLAGLARVSLARGELAQAQPQVEEIMDFIERNTLDGTYERFRIYLTCYQLLTKVRDGRATPVLEKACDLLRTQAARISSEPLRRSFLENVAVHGELVRLKDEATRS
jgi:tetratricopeptide (TPR) repeat protein